MNALATRLKIALAGLFLLCGTGIASAYYDPSVSRWINRDPIREPGFKRLIRKMRIYSTKDVSLYSFASQSPVGRYDAFGLEAIGGFWEGVGLTCCGVHQQDANNAYNAGQQSADDMGYSGAENEAMRHCVASGVLATSSGCGSSKCVGDGRETGQNLLQGQADARAEHGRNNNGVGRRCAGCSGNNGDQNPGERPADIVPVGFVVVVIPHPGNNPTASTAEIEACCADAVDNNNNGIDLRP